jgi:sn-glycerol 3-phosphate transport system permease protein
MILVVMAAVWKQISYNFLFFLAGLQSIPKSVIEAGAIDGAGRCALLDHRLPAAVADHVLPAGRQHRLRLLRHFGIIDAVTGGGPAGRHHHHGLQGLCRRPPRRRSRRLGAQSVVLMVIVIALTAIQFRYVERKVQY